MFRSFLPRLFVTLQSWNRRAKPNCERLRDITTKITTKTSYQSNISARPPCYSSRVAAPPPTCYLSRIEQLNWLEQKRMTFKRCNVNVLSQPALPPPPACPLPPPSRPRPSARRPLVRRPPQATFSTACPGSDGIARQAESRRDAINSHPVVAPHMAPLVMHYELFCNRSWGWSSGTTCVLSLGVKGSKRLVTTFLFSRLLRSQKFLCRFL